MFRTLLFIHKNKSTSADYGRLGGQRDASIKCIFPYKEGEDSSFIFIFCPLVRRPSSTSTTTLSTPTPTPTMDGPKHSVSSRLSTSTMSLFGKFAKGPPRPPPKDNWYLQNKLASKSSVSLAPSAASVAFNTPSLSPYSCLAQDRERASSSHETLQTLQVPHAPPPLAMTRSHSDLSQLSIPRTMSPASTRTASASEQQNQRAGGFRRGLVSKLSSSLGRRTTIRQAQTQPQTRRQGPMAFFSRSNASQHTFASTQDGHGSDDVAVYESPEGDDDVSRPWNVKVRSIICFVLTTVVLSDFCFASSCSA